MSFDVVYNPDDTEDNFKTSKEMTELCVKEEGLLMPQYASQFINNANVK